MNPVHAFTHPDLVADLRRLGVPSGATLVVHSSLSAIGYVIGGSQTVVEALREALGPAGTLLAPTLSGDLTDPAGWSNPPVLREQWQAVRDHMPLFNPQLTPPRGMGAIAEQVLRYAAARRSWHPTDSFAALGPLAAALTDDHPWDDPMGPQSPLGRAHSRGGHVLLIGVGHDSNTALHLAESLADAPYLDVKPAAAPWRREGGRTVWRPMSRVADCSGGFPNIEPVLRAQGAIRDGRLGQAACQLMALADLVDIAVAQLRRDPTFLLCDDETCGQCGVYRRRREQADE